MRRHGSTAQGAVFLAIGALIIGAWPSAARAQAPGGGDCRAFRIEARFVDPASGQEAPWGATGQILIPPASGDLTGERWRQVRTVASSPSRQGITLTPGARGLIRVGREVPFAGWFLRHGTECGLLERGSEWREVESALEIVVDAAADGSLRVALTPEFGYLHGRSRRTVAFPGQRVESALALGVETRFAPSVESEAFYRRLLAGYDPLRRVWPIELVLRAECRETVEP